MASAAQEPVRAAAAVKTAAGADDTACCCFCWKAVELRHSCQADYSTADLTAFIMLSMPFICALHLQQCWVLFRKMCWHLFVSFTIFFVCDWLARAPSIRWSSSKVCFSCQTSLYKSYMLSLTRHHEYLCWLQQTVFVWCHIVARK